MRSIDIFPWNENFNTGISEIDEQHKVLVRLLNQLANHVAFKSDIPALNVIFDELADYAVYHFQTEEAIWHTYLPEDPLESLHKEVHNSFISSVLGLRGSESQRPEEDVIEDVLGFLTRWLASHILENDRYLAKVVLAMRSGLTLELAKQHATIEMSGSSRALIDIILSLYDSLSANTLQLMRELSEHKRQDAEIQRDHQLFLSMLESSPIAVRIATSAGRKVLYANQRYTKLINAAIEDVVGADPQLYYTNPDDYQDTLDQLGRGVPIVNKLVELSIPDAGKVWALATYSKTDYENKPCMLGWFYDVTHIRDAEAQLHLLADNVSDVISRHDLGGTFLFVTASCLPMLGYKPEELIGHSCYEFFHPDDVAGIQVVHHQVLEQPGTVSLSYRMKRKDGSDLWVESTVRATRDVSDNSIDIVAETRDITERKRAEQLLLEREAFNRSLFDSRVENVAVLDAQGVIIAVNAAWKRFALENGSPSSIGLGANYLEVCDCMPVHLRGEDANVAIAGIKKVLAGELSEYAMEYACHSPEKQRWFHMLVTPLASPDGGVVVAHQDVTARKLAEDKQRASALYARSLIEVSLDPLVTISTEGKILDVNQATESVTGVKRAQLIGSDFSEYFTEPEKARAGYKQVFRHGHVRDYSLALRHQSGRIIEVLYNASIYHDEHGKVAGVFAAARDVTELKKAEVDLRVAAAAFESQEGMIITDARSVILRINKAFTEITGYTPEESIGQKMNLLKSGVHDASFYKNMWESINATGAWRGEVWNRRKSGEVYPEWLTITAVRGNDGAVTHYVGAMIDITARKADELRIAHLAHYDNLTDLPNRAMLTDRLHQALAQARRDDGQVALLFLDLDKFKAVNDTLGHEVGDMLLKKVAIRLQTCVQRESDTVSRFGGDEFVVLLPRIKNEYEAATVAEKILASIAKEFNIAGHQIQIGTSIGIAIYPQHAQAVDDLMKHADAAMYQAKNAGRNCFRFHEQLQL